MNFIGGSSSNAWGCSESCFERGGVLECSRMNESLLRLVLLLWLCWFDELCSPDKTSCSDTPCNICYNKNTIWNEKVAVTWTSFDVSAMISWFDGNVSMCRLVWGDNFLIIGGIVYDASEDWVAEIGYNASNSREDLRWMQRGFTWERLSVVTLDRSPRILFPFLWLLGRICSVSWVIPSSPGLFSKFWTTSCLILEVWWCSECFLELLERLFEYSIDFSS